MTTKCAGLNCTSTDGTNHSPECRAEHAAAVAGGRFVKEKDANQEVMIRFCPECGSLGEVPEGARDCCPDGSHARVVPKKFAEICKATFKMAITPSAPAVDAGAPQSVSMHAKSLVPLLQSFADRLRNDKRSATMFEGDWDTLQEAIALCRSVVRSAALSASTEAAAGLPAWFDKFLQNVCEIPDRNSPEDEPEAMVATAEELRNCAANAIEQCAGERAEGLDVPLQGWSVYVERNGFHFLTISNNHVAGDEITDDLAALVRTAAAHLLSFVGAGPDHVGGHVALATEAAAGEPVAYTSPDRLAKIAANPAHVDTLWGKSLTNEGENIALYDRPAASGQKLTAELIKQVAFSSNAVRYGDRITFYGDHFDNFCEALLRASSATASDKEGA